MNTAIAIAPLEINRLIEATVEELWTAWTDPDLVARWFAPGELRAEVLSWDARVNGRYRIRMHGSDGDSHTVGGRFIEVKAFEKLVMDWAWEGGTGDVSTVTVEFAQKSDGTEVSIVHEGLPDADSIVAHREGWDGCLAKLVDQLGRGTGDE